MKDFYRNLLTLLISITAFQATAQLTDNSPYSRLGIGDLSPSGSIRNIGMAGVGVASPNLEYINFLNPALLTTNRRLNLDTTIKYTMFEGALYGVARSLNDGTLKQNSNSVNFQYLNLTFPVSNRWTSSISLSPFSTMSYDYYKTVALDTSGFLSNTSNIGTGGLYIASFANGVDLTKNFSAGLTASYVFGSTNENFFTQLTSLDLDVQDQKYGIRQRTFYSGFNFKPGLAFRGIMKSSGREEVEHIYYNLGATYDFFAGVTARRDLIREIKNDKDAVNQDSIVGSSKMGVVLPSRFSVGFSIDKPVDWSLGVDFTYLSYSQYKNFDAATDNFKNGYKLAVGGEYKLKGQEVMKMPILRAGFAFQKTPLYFNGTQLNDFSVSFGGSMPVGRKDPRYKSKPLARLNVALVAGQRGTKTDGLIRDRYFQVYLSFQSIDKWFERRRIE
jgi:long-subunit fatty acid transport protein